ncbi:DUF455 domain-containing protein [Histoplasma capsulatum G186AR]|uniref:DUF455 domain-containing protein n=1 Tax=Ajellomyces capsulatus TaxID=5037 RepID=A0A8H7YWU5_AJECA|nr:DUF455 domain-containing protein [Histoplasma capsulatum]QSS67044.1 DUF455 domain-containing protein [Histoplasma capsulatum G186AR]
MALGKVSPNHPDDQHIQDGNNRLPHPPWDSASCVQGPLSSQTPVPKSPFSDSAPPGLDYVPSSSVANNEASNPCIQESICRPATGDIALLSQSDALASQLLHQPGQFDTGAQILDSSLEDPEKENEGVSSLDSKLEISMRSSIQDRLMHTTRHGQLRPNNPFLKARQNGGDPRKSSISGPDPFEFPQSSSSDGHQEGNSITHQHISQGEDGKFAQLSSQIPYMYCHYEGDLKAGPQVIETVSPLLEKGKEPLADTAPSITIQSSDPYYQLDRADRIIQNFQLANFSESSSSKEIKPNESTKTDIPPMNSLFDPHVESKSNETLSNPDERSSSTSKPTTPDATIDLRQPPLSHPEKSGQPMPVLQKKLSETYDIRQINWTDGITSSRKSPVLIQNENGPCPLLALVNGLVLRSSADSPSPVVKALQLREKISLGLLMQALFDDITSHIDKAEKLPDIEALSSFLVMLHTGMNVNPRLVLQNDISDLPGSFLETTDTILYGSFKLPLVHGWLAEPSSAAYAALNRVAQSHEDIQLLHFRKEELEHRVVHGQCLTADEEKLIEDIDTIHRFVNVENATQLSIFGLEHLQRCLKPGSMSILFRNDHFSTLFKHPLSNQLFTLVTDAGYAGHQDIVWESLVDVDGGNSSFFSGDFQPVGNSPQPVALLQLPTQNDLATSSESTQRNNLNGTIGKQINNTEQTDADYALALALQFQDEEEHRRTTPRNQAQIQTSRFPLSQSQGVTHRPSSSSNFRQQQLSSPASRRAPQPHEIRSLIPPARTPAANLISDAPPPTYEQAASNPAYTLSPDHSQYHGSRVSNPSIVGPRSSSSGFNNNNLAPNRAGNTRADESPNPALPPRPRDRDRSRDCTVM